MRSKSACWGLSPTMPGEALARQFKPEARTPSEGEGKYGGAAATRRARHFLLKMRVQQQPERRGEVWRAQPPPEGRDIFVRKCEYNTTILRSKIARRAFTARRRREWICRRQIAEQSERRDEHHCASEHKRPTLGGASQCAYQCQAGYEPRVNKRHKKGGLFKASFFSNFILRLYATKKIMSTCAVRTRMNIVRGYTVA